MQFLRANTEVIVTVGPFVDVGDGFTPQTDILLNANEAELIKHGSTSVVDISGATWAAVTNCRGYYSLTLTTALTDTEGMVVVVVQDDSDTLPVKQEYMVLSEAAWDSLYVAKDTGFMDVNVKAVSEDTTAADNLELACDAYSVTRGLTGTALPAAVADAAGGVAISTAGSLDIDATDANVTLVLQDTAVIGALGAGLTDITGRLPSVLTKGTSDSGTTLTMVDSVRSEGDTDYWAGQWIRFTSGNITGQTRLITGFTPASDTITFAPATTQAVSTNTYEILPTGAVDVGQWLSATPNALQSGAVDCDVSNMQTNTVTASAVADGAINAGAIASNAITADKLAIDCIGSAELAASAATEIGAAVWDAVQSSHTTVGSFGITASEIADILVDTATTIPALINGLDDVTAAQVLTQVNAALDTAISELGVAQPSATPSLRTGLMLLYHALAQKFDSQTSGTDSLQLHNAAGTLICEKLITDDGSDYSEARMISG